ncbi:MAG: peptidoglycan editing factor PgeF [Helcococcus sp.]|nr:peptidoglycan editing factor PgeF [Helcococcus sp.]
MRKLQYNSDSITVFDNQAVLKFNNFGDENLVNLFTLKPYNFNKKFISRDNLDRQYEKLRKLIGFDIRFKNPIQTHTNNVKILTEDNFDDGFMDVDGLITNMKGVGLVTSSADCQSVIFYDKENKVIANVHSGWKGTLNKIVENTIELLTKNFQTNPSNLEIGIFPSISRESFEVDEDVKDMFLNSFDDIDDFIDIGDIKDDKQKYYIDTVGINVKMLVEAGVKRKNIHLSGIDSLKNKDIIHSHRGCGKDSGRNIAIIAVKN